MGRPGRPPKSFPIPFFKDIKCIRTLQDEGYTQREMAEYYGITLGSMARYVRKYKEMKKVLAPE